MPNEHSERGRTDAAVQPVVKVNKTSLLSSRGGRPESKEERPEIFIYCLSGVAGLAAASADEALADVWVGVIPSTGLAGRRGLISTDFSLRPSAHTVSRRNTNRFSSIATSWPSKKDSPG